jgi:ELWxxDGT repeat protein
MKTLLLPTLLLLAMLSNATGNFNLVEINPLHGNQAFAFSDSNRSVYGAGSLASITEFKNNLYFVAQEGYDNEELWTSDGTQAGTYLVKDINPNGSSQIGNIVTLGNKMLFMAADNNNWDFDLFVSDGTTGGTQKLLDVNEGWNDALTEFRAGIAGDKLFFTLGQSLMCIDGNTAGVQIILSTQGGYSQAPGNFTALNGKTYFTRTNNMGRIEIWETDGTAQNTQLSIDLSADTNSIWSVSKLFAFDGKLYLAGSGLNSGLFSVNNNGTLSRISFSGNPNYIYNIHVENDQLFFTAYNGNLSNTYLYHMVTGGAAPEVVPSLTNIPVGNGRSLSYCNNAIYFTGTNSQQLHCLSLSRLTHSVIDMPDHSMVNYNSGEAQFLVGANGKVFFAVEETATGHQVFMESDGTNGGTFPVMPAGGGIDLPFNTIQGCGTISVFDFKMFGNKVVVPANFNSAGRELWFYEAEAVASAIADVKEQVEVSLFPNPVANQLTVRMGVMQSEAITVRVIDMQGRLLMERTLKSETSTLDVSTLAAGNYCLSLGLSDKTTISKKFTIAK